VKGCGYFFGSPGRNARAQNAVDRVAARGLLAGSPVGRIEATLRIIFTDQAAEVACA